MMGLKVYLKRGSEFVAQVDLSPSRPQGLVYLFSGYVDLATGAFSTEPKEGLVPCLKATLGSRLVAAREGFC